MTTVEYIQDPEWHIFHTSFFQTSDKNYRKKKLMSYVFIYVSLFSTCCFSFSSLFLFPSIILKQRKKSPSLTLVIENETSQRWLIFFKKLSITINLNSKWMWMMESKGWSNRTLKILHRHSYHPFHSITPLLLCHLSLPVPNTQHYKANCQHTP